MKAEVRNNKNNHPIDDNNNMDEEDDSKIFPQRLMGILADESNQDAICWLPHGKSFILRNRKLFAEMVMPKYFSRKAKYSSFTRKLNRWNFSRVSSGPEIGAYHHEFFLRDKPHLAAQMFCKNARTMLAMASSSSPPATTSTSTTANANTNSKNATTSSAAADKIVPPPQLREESMIISPSCPQVIRPIPTSATSNSSLPPTSAVFSQPPSMNNTMTTNTNDANLLLNTLVKDDTNNMALAYGNISSLQLLERQMQLIQQAQQQEHTNRLLLSLQLGQQSHHQQQQQHQQLHQQASILGNGGGVGSLEEFNLQLQLRQMMELNRRQQQIRQPTNNRASAA